MRQLSKKLALAGLTLMLGTATASANVLVTIEQDGLGSGPIKVISEDGKKWTKILDGDLTLPVKIYLGISKGYALTYHIRQPMATIFAGGELAREYLQENVIATGATKNFAIENLTILNACNDRLGDGAGIQEKQTFWHAVELELVGLFMATNGENYPPYSAYGTVIVPVECLPYAPGAGDVSDGAGDSPNATPPRIKEARLFLTTFSGGKNQGVTMGACATLETTVRFETDKAGPVSFDLHRFPGGMTSHTVNASLDASSGKYYARYQKKESFKSTTVLQYMAESTAPLDGNTGWEDSTIHCGGGLTVDTGDPHDGLPQPLKLKGDFSFAADQGTVCPRKEKALIAFATSVKDKVHYSLDCTNGHFSGVAQPVSKPGGGYVAPAVATFDITKTTQLSCVLKSVAPGAARVHVAKGHKYQCVKTTDLDGSNDLAPDTRPNPQEPDRPGKLVAVQPRKPGAPRADKGKVAEPRIVCANGTVKNGACACARTDKKVKIGKNAYRCAKFVADPPRNKASVGASGAKLKGETNDKKKSSAGAAKPKGSAARSARTSAPVMLAPR